jgi:hypothetical protein
VGPTCARPHELGVLDTAARPKDGVKAYLENVFPAPKPESDWPTYPSTAKVHSAKGENLINAKGGVDYGICKTLNLLDVF